MAGFVIMFLIFVGMVFLLKKEEKEIGKIQRKNKRGNRGRNRRLRVGRRKRHKD